MIHMEYHAEIVIFKKATNFDNVVCCKLYVALYGLSSYLSDRIRLTGRVLHFRSRGQWIEPNWRHCVESLEQDISFSALYRFNPRNVPT